MKQNLIVSLIFRRLQPLVALGAVLCLVGSLAAQSLDSEMSTMADNLAKQIKESGLKKVSVVDFADLQGNYNELGRFIAEQLTVNMVSHRKDFSVVDRANLKRILEEHKLSMSGLVDPANAKKLGQIAGLDAIIIGNVIPLKSDVSITAKIISTETAEIVGAGRSSVRRGEEIDQLLDRRIAGGAASTESGYGATSGGSGAATTREKPKAQDSKAISQTFGNLNIVFESLRALDNQTILVNLIFQNKSDKNAIGVGVYREASPQEKGLGGFITTGPPPIPLRSTLLGSDGLQFESDGADLVGIRPIRSNAKDLIEIPAGEEIKTSFKYRTRGRFSTVSPSFRLQAEVLMNPDFWDSSKGERPGYVTPYGGPKPNELPSGCKIHNLVLDIPVRGSGNATK